MFPGYIELVPRRKQDRVLIGLRMKELVLPRKDSKRIWMKWFYNRKMTKIVRRLELSNGNKKDIILPEPSNELRPSCFAFSLHKAGSTLMNGMLEDYSKSTFISIINIPKIVAIAKLGDATCITRESFDGIYCQNGYLYSGWRNYSKCLGGVDFSLTRNVLLVRDPRDRLVSQYFSFGRSHRVPRKGSNRSLFLAARKYARSRNIDEYAISQINWIQRHWNLYHCRLSPSATRIYRYEDVIFRKEEWLADIVDFFTLSYDEKRIKKIARAYDVHPIKENPNAHIRQVSPGNYNKHLSSEQSRDLLSI